MFPKTVPSKLKILCLLAIVPSPAFAWQGYMDVMGMNISTGNMVFEQSRMDAMLENNGEASNDDVKNVAPLSAPRVSASMLNYSPSQSIRRANIAKFAQSMKKSDPENAAQIESVLAGGKIIDQLDQMMRPMGLRANNVADAYALWWVIAWHAVNKQPLVQNNQLLGAVKAQASNGLLSTPQFASTSNAQKQELAESLLIQAALIDGHIDDAAGNPTQQAALAKAVNQGAKKMGLDLTTMDLTEQGFVPRSGKRSDAGDAVEGAVPGEAGSALAANDAEGNAGADAGQSDASKSDTGKLALYGVGGAALLAGVFALGKSFGGKG